jgi:hypothetical protein
MTHDGPTVWPPRWAESLLRMLLPPEDRDSVSGDLLEEYRESIVPALGRRASRWYIGQVASYVVRKTWIWGALVGAILVTRYLFDTLAPVRYTPGVIHPRSAIMSEALMAIFAFGSGWHAWRSGRLGSGVLVAVLTAALGGLLSAAGTLACLAIWHDPGTMSAIRGSGGLEEALWGVPLLLFPIGLVTGAAGAIVGRVASTIAAVASRPRHTGA